MQNSDLNYKVMRALLSHVVLKLIEEETATHGYSLRYTIKRIYGVSFNHSTIYPLLSDLEKAGLILGSWKINDSKAVKNYMLTDSGKLLLHKQEVTLQYLNHIITQNNPVEVDAWLMQKR